mmetsp:Transcript_102537/g.161847  ORF Transcript_102537/g.161847 Transcript_102537/m.161847 type:complete len:215 (-) Transcript_102537:879-1523(-)
MSLNSSKQPSASRNKASHSGPNLSLNRFRRWLSTHARTPSAGKCSRIIDNMREAASSKLAASWTSRRLENSTNATIPVGACSESKLAFSFCGDAVFACLPSQRIVGCSSSLREELTYSNNIGLIGSFPAEDKLLNSSGVTLIQFKNLTVVSLWGCNLFADSCSPFKCGRFSLLKTIFTLWSVGIALVSSKCALTPPYLPYEPCVSSHASGTSLA